jgi:hypothetical protein
MQINTKSTTEIYRILFLKMAKSLFESFLYAGQPQILFSNENSVRLKEVRNHSTKLLKKSIYSLLPLP